MAENIFVPENLTKVWSDFTVLDEDAYQTRLDINTITSSESAKLVALSFFSDYSGLDGTAYGEGLYNFGITEQEAYDLWLESYNNEEKLAKKQFENAKQYHKTENYKSAVIALNNALIDYPNYNERD